MADETTSCSKGAEYLQGGAMASQDVLDDGKSQASAARVRRAALVDAIKAFSKSRQVMFLDACAPAAPPVGADGKALTNNQPPPPVATPKKSNKTAFRIIGIVSILAAIGGGVYLYSRRNK